MKAVKASLVMVVLVILLAACIDDPTVTPTVSPLPTVSPIALPSRIKSYNEPAAAVDLPSLDKLLMAVDR